MVVERFHEGAAPEIYRRADQQGRQIPEGLRYVSSWVDLEFRRCFQLMESDDPALFSLWIRRWSDLVDFEVIPVRSSADAAAIMKAGA